MQHPGRGLPRQRGALVELAGYLPSELAYGPATAQGLGLVEDACGGALDGEKQDVVRPRELERGDQKSRHCLPNPEELEEVRHCLAHSFYPNGLPSPRFMVKHLSIPEGWRAWTIRCRIEAPLRDGIRMDSSGRHAELLQVFPQIMTIHLKRYMPDRVRKTINL